MLSKRELQDKLQAANEQNQRLLLQNHHLTIQNQQLQETVAALQAKEQALIRSERAAVDSMRELAWQYLEVLGGGLVLHDITHASSSDLEVADLMVGDF